LQEYNQDTETDKRGGPKVVYGRRGIFIFSIGIAVLLAVILILALPQFQIRKITVEGCNRISPDELIAHSGLVSGEHLFRNISGDIIQLFTLRYGNIETELRNEYPYISNIIIQVTFPSEVRITVEERQKIGYIQIPDGYAVVDMDGYIVEMSGEEVPEGVPLMLGIPVRSAVLGQKIDLTDTTGLNNCITVLGAILGADENMNDESGYSLMKCVKSLRSVENGITFLTILLPSTQQELLVRIGSLKDISEQMSWLRYAVSMNKFDGDIDGVLDMSGETWTYRPVD